MTTRLLIFLAACFLVFSSNKCKDDAANKKILSKIEFDVTTINDQGYIDGETSMDYEFCIPKDEAKVNEIKSIVPDVNMPRMAKGRIKCSEDEWLCIVNTQGPKWKENLYAIASLPYVKRIIATHYE